MIDAATYSSKRLEFQDQQAGVRLLLETLERDSADIAALAVKAFELSQSLRKKWLMADYAAKRVLLEIVCLNLSLSGKKLTPVLREPFDSLARA